MDLPQLRANGVEFPGRARELQQAGATAALIRELGDNYRVYHEFLERRLEEVGGDPDAELVGDLAEYVRRADVVQRIVASELLLRHAWAHRQHGRDLNDPLLDHPPLYDWERRLVDVEHPERATFRGRLASGPQGSIPPPRYPEP